MFFIAQGICSVEQQDRISSQSKTIPLRQLNPGDYFGVSYTISNILFQEVGLIYNSRRSATVMSVHYSTLAEIEMKKFKELG